MADTHPAREKLTTSPSPIVTTAYPSKMRGMTLIFPTSKKASASGKIISALGLGSGKKEIWNVTVQIPGSDASSKIKSDLSGAGFKVDESGTSTAGDSLVADNKTYGVLVVTSKDASKGYWIANYTVTSDQSSN